jgi:hypothetical protein
MMAEQLADTYRKYFEKMAQALQQLSDHMRFYHDYATVLYKQSQPIQNVSCDLCV